MRGGRYVEGGVIGGHEEETGGASGAHDLDAWPNGRLTGLGTPVNTPGQCQGLLTDFAVAMAVRLLAGEYRDQGLVPGLGQAINQAVQAGAVGIRSRAGVRIGGVLFELEQV